MSSNNIFKLPTLKVSMVVGVSMMALTLGACASSGNSSSRYGSVYDYESGGRCSGAPCGAVVSAPVVPSYSSTTTVIGGQPVSPGIVYTDCSQIAAMGCGAPYAPPVPVLPVVTSPVGCPTNTTMASDGTCIMMSSGSAYTDTTITSSGWSTSSSNSSIVSCPSDTTQASDGTCMMNSDATTVTIYPTTGYIPPVDYTAPVYQPIRK